MGQNPAFCGFDITFWRSMSAVLLVLLFITNLLCCWPDPNSGCLASSKALQGARSPGYTPQQKSAILLVASSSSLKTLHVQPV